MLDESIFEDAFILHEETRQKFEMHRLQQHSRLFYQTNLDVFILFCTFENLNLNLLNKSCVKTSKKTQEFICKRNGLV